MFILLLLILLALLTYIYFDASQFWKRKKIAHDSTIPIFGFIFKMFWEKKNIVELMDEVYHKFPNNSYIGIIQITTPLLIIKDLDIIKDIGIKDLDYFVDHTNFLNIDTDPIFSRILVNLKGQEWRDMRATLSPAFTTAKLKNIFVLMNECAENFTMHFEKQNIQSVNVKEVFSRFANDIIATTAFGINVDSIADKDNEFYRMGQTITSFSLIQALKMIVFQLFPRSFNNFFRATFFPKEPLNYFRKIIEEAIKRREEENIVRADVLHLLLEAKKGKLHNDSVFDNEGFTINSDTNMREKKQWTNEDVFAQCFMFFLAGFDTISTAACFISYELAVNPDVQKRLQEEIDEVKKSGTKIKYEILLKMPYLDQVISEGLRKWPPAMFSDRVCTKDYTFKPVTEEDVELTIPKGLSISIPVACIQMDPKYYPDPEKFRPERFSEENKSNFTPGSYYPFGIGPRNCIASRFALLELKVLFFHLLSKFDIIPVKETIIPYKIPSGTLSPSPRNLVLGLKVREL